MRIVYFVNAAWYFELHWLDRSEAAISKGYEVHLVSKFGLRSAEIVKERFSKEIVIDKTLCVYNKILSTTKR